MNLPTMTSPLQSERPRLQGGFSLIELMIAITLGLLILAGMLTIFVNTSAVRNEIERTNRQIENGRYAMELLRDDIQLAGFLGEIDLPSVPDYTGAIPDLCSTSLLERTWPAGGSPGVIRLHVQGANNFDASSSTALDSCPAIKSAVQSGTDVLLVRRAKTCYAGATGCDALTTNKPYLQISFCSAPTVASASTTKTHALAIRPAAGDYTPPEFVHMNNSAVGTACTVTASQRPYVVYMYFVGTDNILKRAELKYTGTATDLTDVMSLAEGIENMQLDYGVDSNNDGNADSYAASPATVDDWKNVVSVQVNLLARNTEISTDYKGSSVEASKTYYLGPSAGNVGPFSDGYRRHVYSARVRIQNISGRREKP